MVKKTNNRERSSISIHTRRESMLSDHEQVTDITGYENATIEELKDFIALLKGVADIKIMDEKLVKHFATTEENSND